MDGLLGIYSLIYFLNIVKSTRDFYIIAAFVKYLLAFIFVFIVGRMQAQVLKGTVKDGISGEYLSTVIIKNETTNSTAYSNHDGAYSLNAKVGDAVSFSLVGYKPQHYTVPSGLGTAEMYVSLFPQDYELDEFILKPKYTPYQLDSMQRRSTYARTLARSKGGSLMSPVSFVAEKLSKRSKRLYHFQKDFYKWEEEKFIATKYTPELVASQTHLTGDTIAYFINANPMPYDFARAASDLEIKIWIREQYKDWMKHPVIPTINSPKDSTASH